VVGVGVVSGGREVVARICGTGGRDVPGGTSSADKTAGRGAAAAGTACAAYPVEAVCAGVVVAAGSELAAMRPDAVVGETPEVIEGTDVAVVVAGAGVILAVSIRPGRRRFSRLGLSDEAALGPSGAPVGIRPASALRGARGLSAAYWTTRGSSRPISAARGKRPKFAAAACCAGVSRGMYRR
jgi:hypothetical protein